MIDSPPVIAPKADVTAEATSAAGAAVTYSAPATSDALDGAGVATCAPASGSTFAIGDTTVTCNATDTAGNAADPTTFVVHVKDTTAPTIAAMSTVTAQATSATGAVVTYAAPATSDAVDGASVAVCAPASGSAFPMGNTTVTCTATDQAGNTRSATFTVTVRDTTAPQITGPGPLGPFEATGPAGRVVTYSVSATDLVDASVTVSCSRASGSTFPIGITSVTCTATDDFSNAASTSFTVTVVDTTPPVLTLPAPISVTTGFLSGAVVTYAASALDLVSGTVPAICAPASGSLFAPGTTTVACSATDGRGNSASGSFTVTVTVVIVPYGFTGVQNLPPPASKTFKPGSAVPLAWRFTVNGTVGNTTDALPEVRIQGPSGTLVLTPEDPGASSFQPPTAANGWTWQFNWQTKNLPTGTYKVWVGSRKTGQTYANGTRSGRSRWC